MSAHYRCAITVQSIRSDRLVPVATTVKNYWNFDTPDFFGGSNGDALESVGEGSVSGPIDEFAKNLAIEIWKANQDKCEVTLDTVYLEDLPTDSFHFDESDYIEIMAKS